MENPQGQGAFVIDEPKRNLAKVTIDGSRRRAVHLHAEQVFQGAEPLPVDFPAENDGPRETETTKEVEWVDL